jgi:hypothetical protein
MRARADRSRLPRPRPLRVAALVTALSALLVATAGSAHAAGTIVSGTKEDGTPMIIDPSQGPAERVLSASTSSPWVFFIQSLQASKTITSVTLGDLGVDSAACGASGTASVKLTVYEHASGDFDQRVAFTTSSAPVTLTTTLGRVTWSIPVKSFVAGRGYSFQLSRMSGCSSIKQRTWAHVDQHGNALSSINAGPATCVSGPALGMYGDGSTKRMWHVAGATDYQYPCVPANGSGLFNPAIKTGWLISVQGQSWNLTGAVSPYGENHQWALQNACNLHSGASLLPYGASSFFAYESPSGSYKYLCNWPQFAPPGTTTHRGWYYALPWHQNGPGVRDMYVRLGPATYDNPATFRPHLRFDSDETYRPLDVASFQSELFPSGEPFSNEPTRHQVCNGNGCWDLTGDSSLVAGDTINIHGEGNADNYHSPGSNCWGGDMRDCGTGPASSIYYHETINSPQRPGTHYIDYWVFYRYNDWQVTNVLADHEGDWESVTIGKSASAADTFDFASFSQHGYWYSYLRGNLSCDGAGAGSCGTAAALKGRRIDTFVANGSHANYPLPCGDAICDVRTDPHGEYQDSRHDGADQWGNDDLRSALKPTSNAWAEWAGSWGSADSPGHQGNGVHYDNPWSGGCSKDNEGCNEFPLKPQVGVSAAARASRDGRCGSWFGGHVRAVACAPAQLSRAARGGGLGTRGTFGFELPLRASRKSSIAAASAPGLAQTVGAPLRPGQRLTIKGKAAEGTVLLARAETKSHIANVEFAKLGLRRGGRATIVVSSSKGRPSLRLVQPGGARVKPAAVRMARKR